MQTSIYPDDHNTLSECCGKTKGYDDKTYKIWLDDKILLSGKVEKEGKEGMFIFDKANEKKVK